MGDEWTTIGEIAEVFDGPHATPKKIDTGPYFLSISSLDNGKLDLLKSAKISEEQFVKWTKRVTPMSGDVLFSYETRLGEAALMPSGIRACLGRRMGLLRPDTGKVDPHFLLFAYLGPDFQREIRARTNSGATVDRIALKELPKFPIRMPPLSEQKVIAHILGSLDNKIQLNRQMNTTLEAMAQTLFKSWFVNFDPVIDKALAAGNPIPGSLHKRAEARRMLGDKRKPLPADVAQHFPDRFVFNEEMGWVPEGWEIGNVEQLGKVICGKTPPTRVKEYYGTDVPFITIPDMHNSVYVTKSSRCLSLLGADSQKNKYLPPNSICVSCIATPGLVVLNNQVAQTNQQINSVVPTNTDTSIFCYETLSGLGNKIRISGSGGSVFSNLNKGIFEKLKVLIPPRAAQVKFDENITPCFGKLLANQKEITTLARTRDTLLPKLLSGQLRIPNAENFFKDANSQKKG